MCVFFFKVNEAFGNIRHVERVIILSYVTKSTRLLLLWIVVSVLLYFVKGISSIKTYVY